jgi:3'-phosphoadenosine 5'-phosphosulfate sulfotransferase (PAPS reductase)/FAD synthetase
MVYVGFSGGQDSTVLADMTARICSVMGWKLVLVFCDTGLEHRKIKSFVPQFVKWLKTTYTDLDIEFVKIRPEISFVQVIKEHGYPVIGKDISNCVKYYRKGSQWAINNFEGLDADGNVHTYKQGMYPQWKFLVDAPFPISDACCDILKLNPFLKYEKETGRLPILGLMAYESKRRKNAYLRGGCNSFENDRPMSTPMGYWLKQDILWYLKKFNVPYSEAYGVIVEEWTNYKRKENKPTGKLKCTGNNRTGCQFCLFAIQQDGEPNRFQRMKEEDPIRYDYCIREENGLGIGKVMDYMGYPY